MRADIREVNGSYFVYHDEGVLGPFPTYGQALKGWRYEVDHL